MIDVDLLYEEAAPRSAKDLFSEAQEMDGVLFWPRNLSDVELRMVRDEIWRMHGDKSAPSEARGTDAYKLGA